MSEDTINPKPCSLCDRQDIKIQRFGFSSILIECICGCKFVSITDLNQAIKLWNARPIEDKLQARINELEKYIDKHNRKIINEINQT